MKNFLLLFLLLCFSCKKEKFATPVDFGYSYIPVNVGHWVIYDVDSAATDVFIKKTNRYHYQIKEYFESVFKDNQDRNTLRIERYKRDNENQQWQIIDVWYANKTTRTYEKVEENIRFIRLTFPVLFGTQWNGNSFTEYPPQNYSYNSVDEPSILNGVKFDSTLTVMQQQKDSSLVSGDYAYEKYARNIGLIYKRFYQFRKTSVYGDTSKYIDYTYIIKEFGNN